MQLHGGESIERRVGARWFLALWLCLAALFLALHFRFYFVLPHLELGDLAADALQIHDAKYLRELHGQYSRWGFHHTGPGFFYVYAIGEWILRDLLRVVPSAYNAHAIAGLLLQTGFFSWSLWILQQHLRFRLLTPVLLVLAALHFGAVGYSVPDSVFASTWAAHVLAFPFLCLLVSCASLAAGRAKSILPATLSACFLAHGHVAQPLFVVPLFVSGVVLLALDSKRETDRWSLPISSARREWVAAGVILASFLLPLAIDLCHGPSSNLRLIAGHFSRHPEKHKTLLQSLTYLATYFGYVPDPEKYCDSLGAGSWNFFMERWPAFAVWAVIVVATAWLWPSVVRRSRFAVCLTLYVAAALGLTICWGILQTGPLYGFNSYFNFAILFAGLTLFGAAISHRLETRASRFTGPVLLFIATPLFAATAYSWHFDRELGDIYANLGTFANLEPAVVSDGKRVKFLTFTHDDWWWMSSIAVALERMGYDYRVPAEERFMFGERHVRDITASVAKGIPIWRRGVPKTGTDGFALPGGQFVATGTTELPQLPAQILFTSQERNAPRFALFGWDFDDPEICWSNAASAALYFRHTPATSDVIVSLDVSPAVSEQLKTQRLIVGFSGSPSETYTCSEPMELKFRIPASQWNRTSVAVLTFAFPDATSPFELGLSADARKLGFGFNAVRFSEAGQATDSP